MKLTKATIALIMLSFLIITGCNKDDNVDPSDTTAPVLVSTDPSSDAIDVTRNKTVSIVLIKKWILLP